MFAGAAPGFSGAPVTKGLLALIAAASLIAAAGANGGHAPPAAVAALALGGPVSCVFGLGALYHARTIERLLGPAKYGCQVALSAAISGCLRAAGGGLAALVWRSKAGGSGGGAGAGGAAGPLAHAILFAVLVALAADVPPTAHFSLAGVPLTDRAFTYAAAAQLMWAGGRAVVGAAAAGVAAGLALRDPRLAALEAPPAVQVALGRLCGVLGGTHRSVVVVPAGGGVGGGATPAPPRRVAARVPVQPSPAAVQQLVAMGFAADRARAALRDSGNDVQAALAALFD